MSLSIVKWEKSAAPAYQKPIPIHHIVRRFKGLSPGSLVIFRMDTCAFNILFRMENRNFLNIPIALESERPASGLQMRGTRLCCVSGWQVVCDLAKKLVDTTRVKHIFEELIERELSEATRSDGVLVIKS